MSDDKPSLWDEIRRISDELEVKVHLGTMEARDRWEQLKPRVQALQAKLDEKATHASEWAAEEMKNVSKLLSELRDDVAARIK